MNNPKINKFGSISEGDNGELFISDFEIDCGSSTGDTVELILKLTIERLDNELKEHKEGIEKCIKGKK